MYLTVFRSVHLGPVRCGGSWWERSWQDGTVDCLCELDYVLSEGTCLLLWCQVSS